MSFDAGAYVVAYLVLNFGVAFCIGLLAFWVSNKLLKTKLSFSRIVFAQIINFSLGVGLVNILRTIFDKPLITDPIISIATLLSLFFYFSNICRLDWKKSIAIVFVSYIISSVLRIIVMPFMIFG
ncbi:MAG: hypothetical protein ABH874_07415 [Methanobacteriota archaeon]